MLVRFGNVAQSAEVLDLPFTQEVPEVSTTSGSLTTEAVAEPRRPDLLLVLPYGSLLGRRLSPDSAPDGDSKILLSVKKTHRSAMYPMTGTGEEPPHRPRAPDGLRG